MTWTYKYRGAAPAMFIADHQCNDCEHRWEESFPKAEDHEPVEHGYQSHLIGQCCPNCGRYNTAPTDGTRTKPVTIVRGNHDFAERQNKRLYERSTEHYRREGKDEAIERQRKVFKEVGSTSDDLVAKVP